ncbi:replication factor C subunit 1 [Orussus abietinus]|uniref:replication factor C subunit 1 n=1 Tax=Orussus abietinus TaxID=222816 RepID=UPI000625CE5B|nr:replication factor C subunit 1 [Orussus abietinus]
MSKDIRSYFTVTPNKALGKNVSSVKPRKRAVISSDEDDVQIISPVKRQKVAKKHGRYHVLSDSDEETIQKKVEKSAKPKQPEPKKVISAAEMFGTAPVKRIAAPKVTKKLQNQEAKFHEDDDFETTLRQLDTSEIENKYVHDIDTKDENNVNHKHKHTSESKSRSPKDDGQTKGFKDMQMKGPEVQRNKGSDAVNVSSRTAKEDMKSPKKLHHKSEQKSSSTPQKKHSKSSTSSSDDYSLKRKKQTENSSVSEKVNLKRLKKRSEGVSEITIVKKPKTEEHKKSPKLDPYEERIKQKKQSAALYQQYLHRGGARHPGSKKVPEGAEYCLTGLSFLITGVLDSLEREEAEELITKYGGRIQHQVSKKTDYVIVGDQPGPAKLAKADSFQVKQISEDDLLELIHTRPGGKPTDIKQSRSRSEETKKQKTPDPKPIKTLSIASTLQHSPQKNLITEINQKKELLKKDEPVNPIESCSKAATHCEINTTDSPVEAMVEKYRPKSMKQLIGQQGDKSNAKKLFKWLQNWHKNHSGKVKLTKPSPWSKNDDGAFFKAALLSGPPGIGKTTTVYVVCKELGMDPIEFNASDTRSKRLLKENVSEILSNTTMKNYFVGNSTEKPGAKHVLVMDEVDGMAGNEDRGGLQELIALIKSSSVPVICICNDRNNPKMRTLANYTFDLRFQKPRLEQIRASMKSICFKENIEISNEDLDRLIEATNQDIRQVINYLAMLTTNGQDTDKSCSKQANKHLKLGPWDVVRKVFSSEEHKTMTIHDKCDLFFHDYNIAPLFVQENYLSVIPLAPQRERLERVAKSADSLSLSDLVETAIRSKNSWSLLPTQAVLSSAIPGSLMSGRISSQINFPSWLGRNSKRNKFDRLIQEVAVHSTVTTSASKEAMNLDYLKYLRDTIVRPLAQNGAEGVKDAVETMVAYHLTREDLDSLIEVSLWPGQHDPMHVVESKIKAAFTREYNKHPEAESAIGGGTSKKKSKKVSQDEGFIEGEDEEIPSEQDEDDLESDKMIKAKKSSTSKKAESSSKEPSKPSKRGKGRGKAK